MHVRAPSPHGLNARRCASVTSAAWPASQRSGTNSAARGQIAGSRWMAQITVCVLAGCSARLAEEMDTRMTSQMLQGHHKTLVDAALNQVISAYAMDVCHLHMR